MTEFRVKLAHVHEELQLGLCAKFGGNWLSSLGMIAVIHNRYTPEEEIVNIYILRYVYIMVNSFQFWGYFKELKPN